jgi:hypothetical protein
MESQKRPAAAPRKLQYCRGGALTALGVHLQTEQVKFITMMLISMYSGKQHGCFELFTDSNCIRRLSVLGPRKISGRTPSLPIEQHST